MLLDDLKQQLAAMEPTATNVAVATAMATPTSATPGAPAETPTKSWSPTDPVRIGKGSAYADHSVWWGRLRRAGRPRTTSKNPKGDFLAVVVRMGFNQRGESVMDGMGRCQAGAFKPDSAQQGVRLDDAIQGWRDEVSLTGNFSSHSMAQQSFITELSDAEPSDGAITTAFVR